MSRNGRKWYNLSFDKCHKVCHLFKVKITTFALVFCSFPEPLDCIEVFMRDCKCCDGVSLEKGSQEYLRQQIKTEEANYVDLRNYLFSRQCKLLLKFKKNSPWEIAQRTLEFLHNLKHELAMETVKVCFVTVCLFYCQNDVCMAESMIIWDSLKFEPSLQAKLSRHGPEECWEKFSSEN